LFIGHVSLGIAVECSATNENPTDEPRFPAEPLDDPFAPTTAACWPPPR
jgi:hypothetical protein